VLRLVVLVPVPEAQAQTQQPAWQQRQRVQATSWDQARHLLVLTLLTQQKLGWQAAAWQQTVEAQAQTRQPAQQQLQQAQACWGTS
jgi:hypothetical protein